MMAQEANVHQLLEDSATRINRLSEKYPRCIGHINSLKNAIENKPFATDLIEYLIEEYISRNEPCADQIIRTVDILKDEHPHEVVPAIKKAARAIYNNRINIFFSYKLKDVDIATAVVEQIRGISDTKLNVVFAKEFKTGENYRKEIMRTTRNAHWFILLLPDPADDWDWCLYESGLFRAKKLPGDRLICIHHKDNKIPDQISNFNAVAASEQDLKIRLHELFCKDNPIPGMKAINKKANIQLIAETIAREVSPPSSMRTYPFHEFVSVNIDDGNKLAVNNDLNRMRIVDCTPGKLELFGKSERSATWGELAGRVIKENVEKNNDLWRTELRRALRAAQSKDIPDDIHSTFTGCNGKHYRPVLHAKVQAEATGKIHSYIIDFVEDIKAIDKKSWPEDLRIIAIAVRLAIRFRWEVAENKRYRDHVMCEEEADEIRMAIDRIMLEANQAGLQDPELLKKQFHRKEHKERIDSMFMRWQELMNNEGTGLLDEALRNRDASRASQILKELSPLNKEFLKLVSERFSEMLK
jgi:hypothetical protein